jgi:uncharacterized membrane protein YtjA (UPF0391 family)
VRRATAPIRREMRRRAVVEPVIGHRKAKHRMDRNYLNGRAGDRINAVLAAGYNFGYCPASGTGARDASLMSRGPVRPSMEGVMLYWALVFLIIAIIAAIFGFGGIASTAAGIAQILFFVFLVVFVISLIMGLAARRRPPI